MAMSENSKRVLSYLKSIGDDDVTAADVAAALGLEKKSVDSIFTSAIQRKNLGERVPYEVENPDGGTTLVKFLKLNADGKAYDPDAVVAAAE